MRTALGAAALCLSLGLPAAAQGQGLQDPLLDQFVGTWVMTGMIAGDEVTHDIVAEWVLGHHYLRFREVAREKDDAGMPAYEAIVFIGWDETRSAYACLWLDVTGGGGLTGEGIGRATRVGDSLPFVFDTGDSGVIYNTMTYDREGDTWNWLIDVERDGETSNFAGVTLTRRE